MSTVRDSLRRLQVPDLAIRGWRPGMSGEALLALVCAYFVLACNGTFWQAVAQAGTSPRVRIVLAVAVFALHACVLAPFAWRAATRPVLAALLVLTACANWYASRYAVLFDVDMLRNILHTDMAESRELLSPGLLVHVAVAGGLPAALVLWTRVRIPSLRQDLRRRALFAIAMLALALVALAIGSQGVFSLMRNDHALRHRITPGNVLVSTVRALSQEERGPAGPRETVAADARRIVGAAGPRRPRVLVLVVGETVRADHWGLNGYARQTTPELARRDVVNFPDVTACGTSTEVSLPCMFSILGREHYDRVAIRHQENLLDVLARTGVAVAWRDNQSGCKGVCDAIGMQAMQPAQAPALCTGNRCLDAILLAGLRERIEAADDDVLIVLHPLGNHGPNYFERYPAAFEHYRPTCRHGDPGRCSRQQIVNAYDNAIGYTDAVLGELIDLLGAQHGHDAAMLYVSDHGESLGEYGLFLHGAPLAIAPRQQLQVPMTLWLSPAVTGSAGIDRDCLERIAGDAYSHDNLFDTVLGFFDVQTRDYRPGRDILHPCRRASAAARA
ncbi:phosphoethanolamine transferase [Luteimonas yindakuii]|nr:phosphoethanolamine--lipid A transferase [Luteimonas yindakuii]